jgi:hypothetical protein
MGRVAAQFKQAWAMGVMASWPAAVWRPFSVALDEGIALLDSQM